MFKGVSDQIVTDVFDGTPVSLRFMWNTRFQFWSVSIFDRQRNLIAGGLKLVQDFPMLGSLALETLPGELYMVRMYGDWDYPRFNSLPEEFVVAYVSAEEMEALRNGTV